ncbi:hypothetical protein Lepto7375DRAFT_1737 [Leptolyngbya sp. PCC 7375]|nr:hypothetical protein Lepto7375DRAFT_1737 [Leptolyngbya sp. PCC 7375]
MVIDFGQRSKKFNLNNFHPDVAPGDKGEWNFVESVVQSGDVTVYFRELEHNLENLISQYSGSVGCIAWLTSVPILEALGRQDHSCIVVQKEDFLRPDGAISKQYLRDLYAKVKGGERGDHRKLRGLSFCSDPTIDGVRCVGNHNSERNPAFPRMHNKFIVLGEYDSDTCRFLEPYWYLSLSDDNLSCMKNKDLAEKLGQALIEARKQEKVQSQSTWEEVLEASWDRTMPKILLDLKPEDVFDLLDEDESAMVDSFYEEHEYSSFCPKIVWTGSFNFTYNAGLSLENAVTISTPEIVNAYYSYWQDIASISEPLNWNSEWVYPEWRIGT